MRVIRVGIAAVALAGATVLGTATAAQADDYTLRGVYYTYAACWRIGTYGAEHYGWSPYFECTHYDHDNPNDPGTQYSPTMWFLWA